ncbi:MAG TPA: hypothetical protein VN809_12570 [Telmatospirillum sp.]|nr:hypothetical protein [Telmatospirillum sp.]
MLFPHPRTVTDHLANGACALLIGCFFAFVGLNAASGCGQSGGACIHVQDLVGIPSTPATQLALANR